MLIITVASLQLLALLLLRHALYLTNGDGEDDAYTFFSVSETSNFFSPLQFYYICVLIIVHFYVHWQLLLLRAVGFLLPCYIMAWAISILQRRRQRQVCAKELVYYASHLQNFSNLLVFVLQNVPENLKLLLFDPLLFLTGSCSACSNWSCIYAAGSTRSEPPVYHCSRACSDASSRATPITMFLYGVLTGIININFNLNLFYRIPPFFPPSFFFKNYQ